MVFIKELLPNPAGKDTAGEWIGIFNDGTSSVNLSGWSVKDAGGKKFTFGTDSLPPNQELKLPYSLTRINLNNDGDTITLYNAQGAPVDEVSYGQVAEEEIVFSPKFTPVKEPQELAATSLEASAFTGQVISADEISPVIIAFGLALTLGIGAALLTKRLLEA